jgi:outer membrane protein TolC
MKKLLLSFPLSALALTSTAMFAQAPTSGSQGGTRAQQLPISGQQSTGSVAVQQNSAPGGGTTTVNTLNTTVQVQGAYLGSVPGSAAPNGTLALSLPEAIRRALQFNLGTIGASNTERQVRAQRLQALSSLLPNVSATFSLTQMKTDLEAVGFTSSTIPGMFGQLLPRGTRPFHYYDAQANASQTIFDSVALNNERSARALEDASKLSQKDARELVILAAGGQYLRTLAAAALVISQEEQVHYAQASYDQAAAQYKAGTKAAVDTQRSQVELQTEQQRLTSNRADLRKSKLTLLRIIGLPLRTEVTLKETLGPRTGSLPELDGVLQDALTNRADLQAAGAQLKAAEKALNAAKFEWLPSVTASGYYGIEGINPNHGIGVYGATGSVNVPIWNGGRTHADTEQASAVVAQRRAEFQNQQQVVELDVRNALIDLEVSSEQVRVAESNRKLATDTLTQSQDRFTEGVATSVEVVQSTEALAAADNDLINSLYSQNLAALSLARATGTLESAAPNLFKEQQ